MCIIRATERGSKRETENIFEKNGQIFSKFDENCKRTDFKNAINLKRYEHKENHTNIYN